VVNGTPNANYGLTKLTGPGIQLSPGVENRLYVTSYSASSLSQVTQSTFDLTINIVPCSRGIRDRSNIYG
jgi:hypothetical protein